MWLQLLEGLHPLPACHSAFASLLKFVPRQSCTVVPAGTVTSASLSAEPLACAAVSGAVSVTPVPVAPAVPTVWMIADSPPTMMWWPATRPVTEATLTLVAPTAEAALSVVLRLASTRCVPSGIAATILVPVGVPAENVTASPT